MTREELKELGLTDEQIEQVMASHGKAINEIKAKADKVEGLEAEIVDYKEQIKTRDEQLETLGEKTEDDKDLKEEIARLKEENKKSTDDLKEKLEKQAFDFALERTLTNAKVRNTKAIKALLDTEIIKLDGDKMLGLDSQLETIKESDPYLFEEEEKEEDTPQIVPGGKIKGGASVEKNPFTKEHWNLTEQGRLFKEDPDLYNNLKAQAGK